jgi:hypothetical protein
VTDAVAEPVPRQADAAAEPAGAQGALPSGVDSMAAGEALQASPEPEQSCEHAADDGEGPAHGKSSKVSADGPAAESPAPESHEADAVDDDTDAAPAPAGEAPAAPSSAGIAERLAPLAEQRHAAGAGPTGVESQMDGLGAGFTQALFTQPMGNTDMAVRSSSG